MIKHPLIHNQQFKNHRVVVVGVGRSGLAAAYLLDALGAQVCLVDVNSVDEKIIQLAKEKGWELKIGAHCVEQFEGSQLIILSPGIAKKKIYEFAPKIKIISELELASWFCQGKIVCITGTNGKTTTTSLVAHILKNNGYKVFVGGNIGVPFSEYVLNDELADIIVLEVSSFQLQNTFSLHASIAVFLNFAPNHLDFHATEEEYFEAKMQIFKNMTDKDRAIIYLPLKDRVFAKGFKIPSTLYVGCKRFPQAKLIGQHNLENMEAAYLVCHNLGLEDKIIEESINSFVGLEHRLEMFGIFNGVKCINDSKSTTLDSIRVALESVEGNGILLAGGVFKGGNPEILNNLIREKIKQIILFGESREIFEKAWKTIVPIRWEKNLEQAVKTAKDIAQVGDTLLLSPGTASFDLFENYVQRGQAFKNYVRKILGSC